MKTCTNPTCLIDFEPNVNGAVKDLCARCYIYTRRHQGALPGPRLHTEPTRAISVRIPLGFEQRIRKVSELPVATWVRRAAEDHLEELERKGKA